MKKINLFLIFLTLFCSSAWADSFVVQKIEIQGLQRISPETVYNYLPIKRGQTLNPGKTETIIKALYKTGFFEDVCLSRQGNTLVINVMERSTIGQLKITGNSVITTEKLTTVMKGLDVAEGRAYNRATIDRIKQGLLNQYYELGRYNARVNVTASPMSRCRVCVRIDISEGLVAKVRRINIIGNCAFSERILEKQLTITTCGLFTFLTQSDRYSQERLDESLENLRNYYLDHGYIKFVVKSSQVAITPDRKSIYLTIVVDEGCPYSIEGINVTGNTILCREDILKLIKLKEGCIFSRQGIINSEKAISEALGNQGYIGAVVTLQPKVDDKTKRVFVTFNVVPGKRTYVRHIYFSDNSKTNDEVLRRKIDQMEAAVVSTCKLEQSKHQLSMLPYIKDVQMSVVPVENVDDQVDVNYKVTEDNAAQANFSVGYSQRDGIILGAGINQKNFLGTGKTLGFNLTKSRWQQFYGINYDDPYYTPEGISRNISVSFSKVDPGNQNGSSSYTTNQYDASVLYGIPIGQEKGVFNQIQLGYGYENTLINLQRRVSTQVQNFVNQHGRHFQQADLIAGISRDSRDKVIFPTRGMLNTFGVNIYLPISGGLSYYNMVYNTRWYQPLSDRFILTGRGNLSYGNGFTSVYNYPFYKNFYAGGMDSVRGYEGYTLGPRDSNTKPTGGNAAVTGSLGLIFPNFISDNLRTTAFVDGGNAYNTFNNRNMGGTAAGPVRFSAGVEGDYLSPIGLIAVSLAKPINRQHGRGGPSDEERIFDFSLGANFG